MKWFSTGNSVRKGEVTVLAILETIVLSTGFVSIVSLTESFALVFLGAAVLPLGLIQTPQSRLLLRRLWAGLELWCQTKSKRVWAALKEVDERPIKVGDENVDIWNVGNAELEGVLRSEEPTESLNASTAIVILYRFPLSVFIWALVLFMLPALSVAFVVAQLSIAVAASGLFVYSTVLFAIRNPLAAIRAVPENFSRICWCTDSFSEPRVIPESVNDKFFLTKLIRPSRMLRKQRDCKRHFLPVWIHGRRPLVAYERIMSKAYDVTTTPFLYAISALSRMSVKSSLFMYGSLSLIWAQHVEEEDLEPYLNQLNQLSLNKFKFWYSVLMITAFAAKVFLLVRIEPVLKWYSNLGGQFDWLVLPTQMPLWQATGLLNAMLSIFLFLYSEQKRIELSSPASNKSRATTIVNFIRVVGGALTVYTSFCLVVIFARESNWLDFFSVGPILPF